MEPVDTINFVENDWKFVSFGEDKRVIQYELGYTVIIKNLFYEDLPAICRSYIHPNKNYIIG